MIKKMMSLIILPFSLNAMDIEDAQHWAKHGNIAELRTSYLAITAPHKDKDIIPVIRINGHLEAFYISLAQNGNIEDLARLMNMDCLLTTGIRSKVFNATLTVYKNEIHTWNDEARDLYADFLSRQVDFVHDELQSDWRSIFLKQAPKHIFSAAEQAAFDQESALWANYSF
jgi:hypothetical protein